MNYWDKSANKYEHRFGFDSNKGRRKLEFKYSLLKKAARLEGKEVLELGCGTGVFTEMIARDAKKVVAVDNSREMLSKTEKLPNVEYILGDVRDALEGKYEIVVGSYILQYLDLKEIVPLLYRSAERVAFIEPNILHPYVFMVLNPIGKKVFNRPSNSHAFSPHELRREFNKVGFKTKVELVKYGLSYGGSLIMSAWK